MVKRSLRKYLIVPLIGIGLLLTAENLDGKELERKILERHSIKTLLRMNMDGLYRSNLEFDLRHIERISAENNVNERVRKRNTTFKQAKRLVTKETNKSLRKRFGYVGGLFGEVLTGYFNQAVSHDKNGEISLRKPKGFFKNYVRMKANLMIKRGLKFDDSEGVLGVLAKNCNGFLERNVELDYGKLKVGKKVDFYTPPIKLGKGGVTNISPNYHFGRKRVGVNTVVKIKDFGKIGLSVNNVMNPYGDGLSLDGNFKPYRGVGVRVKAGRNGGGVYGRLDINANF